MALLTTTEVMNAAFLRTINLNKIPSHLIDTVQEKHIRPLLGDDFYEAVIATPASYATLVAYLKNIIAYYVKFYILPDIFNEITDIGINQLQGQNRQITDRNGLEYMRQQAAEMAKDLTRVTEKYLYDNQSLYPLYNHSLSPMANIVTAGGILFKKNQVWNKDKDDDGPDKWK